jgi:hypothetical protein
MPKKKREETQAEQSARFQAEVERLIAAGELSADEADAALDRLVCQSPAKRLNPTVRVAE